MWFVKNPEHYDVIVTDNLFGDIITDLAAVIQGGLGVAAGGNINPKGVSMYEPMGGSAPKYTARMSSTQWPPSALWRCCSPKPATQRRQEARSGR